MNSIKTWVSAMRLRTLPLAASAILLGITLSDLHYSATGFVAVLCLTTAICLQVLSNFANDYGDFIKGTDNDTRIGNTRALQSGSITVSQMKRAIMLLVVLTLVSGITLLYKATQGEFNTAFLLFFALGIVAIVAAIKYTVGKRAYGYSGLGDVAVFIFFGPVSVVGTFLLCNGFEFEWGKDWAVLLPALSVGLLSTAVLNTNNIRDIENDEASGKYTIPVKIGLKKARIYHSVLIIVALFSFVAYIFVAYAHWVQFIQILAMFPIVKTWMGVLNTEPSTAYNGFLKQLSLGTLVLVIVFIVTNTVARMTMASSLILSITQ
ncbi:MAG: 1,4-dihydroxy-2-naphthoate octaprenyltransferase [Bacteroidota bacterium]